MRKITLLFVCAILLNRAFAQDFQFTHALVNTSLINPASIGHQMEHSTRVSAVVRSLWNNPGIMEAYQGGGIALEWRHCPSKLKSFFALGLTAQYDGTRLGGIRNVQALPTLAYNQYLSENCYVSVGGSLGFLNYGLSGNGLKFDAQYQNGYYNGGLDDQEALTGTGRTVVDMAAGVEVFNPNEGHAIGISWCHLNRPSYSFLSNNNELGISWNVHGTYAFRRQQRGPKSFLLKCTLRKQSFLGTNSKQWQLLPGMLYRSAFLSPDKNHLQCGIYLRIGGTANAFAPNALIPSVTWQNPQYAIHLTYDANLSGLVTTFAGGIEIAFSKSFGQTDKCIRCPTH